MNVEIVSILDRYEPGVLRIERQTSPVPKPPSWFADMWKFGYTYVALYTDHANHDAIAGFVVYDHGAVTKIHRLAVALRFRRKGIGRALLDHVMDSERCRPYVVVDTPESFASLNLLTNAGFRLWSVREHSYGQRWRYDAEVTA